MPYNTLSELLLRVITGISMKQFDNCCEIVNLLFILVFLNITGKKKKTLSVSYHTISDIDLL